jgi:transposase
MDFDRIRKLRAAGLSFRAVAREVGCSINTVQRAVNTEAMADYQREYRKNNRDKFAKYQAKWEDRNRQYKNEKEARRRARKLSATPAWLTESDLDAMRAIYAEAQRLTNETGILHHVDHIYPLKGRTVCGLHCPLNLQILTATDNLSKGARYFG